VPNEVVIRISAHRQNIDRYKALLKTQLTGIERQFIDRRIAEEESEVRRLSASVKQPSASSFVANRQTSRASQSSGDLTPG
jgi:uncharacterized small protein (DUF1192 family)